MKWTRGGWWLVGVLAVAVIVSGAGLARSAKDDTQSTGTVKQVQSALASPDSVQAHQLVDKSRMTLENFARKPQMGAFRDLLKDAKAVFIAPSLMRFGFLFGASGGNGVVLVKDDQTGKWSGPAFYTIGGASFGLQIGAESSEVVLLAMTERGVTALLSSGVKLSALASIAAGPVGMGASAATVNVSADILSFSRAKGLYAGIALDGAVVKVRNGMNQAYYNATVIPMDILIKRTVSNPYSEGLIAQLTAESGRG